MTDLVGGQIPIVVTTTSDVLERHERRCAFRVLATSEQGPLRRSSGRADLREAGYDVEGAGWYGCTRQRRVGRWSSSG